MTYEVTLTALIHFSTKNEDVMRKTPWSLSFWWRRREFFWKKTHRRNRAWSFWNLLRSRGLSERPPVCCWWKRNWRCVIGRLATCEKRGGVGRAPVYLS